VTNCVNYDFSAMEKRVKSTWVGQCPTVVKISKETVATFQRPDASLNV